ncbi:AlwI restriction endonuclease [Mesonia phycicola]|uniref:AlwI restriction endonuclease n=1 Tax=Mesonia phycicola TaxID=579105 RepID=A0A1M6HNU4_9FLAO|nr:AlwI family type II restriction endonuclease [Mesonia phycicola]SHJ23869.1 AlwI restriction endonuclease [Mesonia phycicola]
MANLSKTKALFAFTSPRTIEKIIPEIKILTENFEGQKWSGNDQVQIDFFQTLFDSKYYEGDSFPANPALAARDRITRAPKALGFVDLKPTVELTEAGKLLLTEKRLDETFTRQLLKFQLPSPYHTKSRTVDFSVKPYLELLRLVKVLGSISKTEIALFFSQLTNYNDFETVVSKIKDFQKNSKLYKGSRKMYVAECFENEIIEIFHQEVQDKKLKTRESSDTSLQKFIKTKRANMKDYADAFVRYIRATELVTFQKRTFRLIISPQKTEEVNYILKEVDRKPSVFKNTSEFKNYLFNPFSIKLLSDNRKLLIKQIESLGLSEFDKTISIEGLKDILDRLRISVKSKNIEEKKKELKDYKELPDILEVFEQIKKKEVPDAPLFLEWNVWRALVMLNYAKRVDGNFIMDIDGMPLNYAPGQKPDIESEYTDFGIITEVTMSGGNTQYKMESESVPRHFGKAKELLKKEMYCLFVAPKISEGTLAHYFNLNRFNTKLYGGKTKIIPLSIDQFIEFIKSGIENKFNNPEKLKNWLEKQWLNNQEMEDENVWSANIDSSILKWAS